MSSPYPFCIGYVLYCVCQCGSLNNGSFVFFLDIKPLFFLRERQRCTGESNWQQSVFTLPKPAVSVTHSLRCQANQSVSLWWCHRQLYQTRQSVVHGHFEHHQTIHSLSLSTLPDQPVSVYPANQSVSTQPTSQCLPSQPLSVYLANHSVSTQPTSQCLPSQPVSVYPANQSVSLSTLWNQPVSVTVYTTKPPRVTVTVHTAIPTIVTMCIVTFTAYVTKLISQCQYHHY